MMPAPGKTLHFVGKLAELVVPISSLLMQMVLPLAHK